MSKDVKFQQLGEKREERRNLRMKRKLTIRYEQEKTLLNPPLKRKGPLLPKRNLKPYPPLLKKNLRNINPKKNK